MPLWDVFYKGPRYEFEVPLPESPGADAVWARSTDDSGQTLIPGRDGTWQPTTREEAERRWFASGEGFKDRSPHRR